MFSSEERKLVRDYLREKMINKVVIKYFSNPSSKSDSLIKGMLSELAGLSSNIIVSIVDFKSNLELAKRFSVSRAPCIVITSDSLKIKFYGFPGGREFPVFLESIVMASSGKSSLTENYLIHKPKGGLNMKVFFTHTCPVCPEVVRLAIAFTVLNPFIDLELIDAREFVDLVRKFNVLSVPKVVINESISLTGLFSIKELIDSIKRAPGG